MKELEQGKKELYVFFHDPYDFLSSFYRSLSLQYYLLCLNSKFYDAPTLTHAYTHMHASAHTHTHTNAHIHCRLIYAYEEEQMFFFMNFGNLT